jgi:hypothetical protein
LPERLTADVLLHCFPRRRFFSISERAELPASASNAVQGRAHLFLESNVWRKDVALFNGHYEHPGALLRSAMPQSPAV